MEFFSKLTLTLTIAKHYRKLDLIRYQNDMGHNKLQSPGLN